MVKIHHSQFSVLFHFSISFNARIIYNRSNGLENTKVNHFRISIKIQFIYSIRGTVEEWNIMIFMIIMMWHLGEISIYIYRYLSISIYLYTHTHTHTVYNFVFWMHVI